MKHTPEPWELGEVGDKCKHLCPAKGNVSILTVALEYGEDGEPTYFGAVFNPDDARRIVSCVNACAGISDENLADDCVRKMREDRDYLLAENTRLKADADRLAEALEKIEKRKNEPGKATGADAIFCFRIAYNALADLAERAALAAHEALK